MFPTDVVIVAGARTAMARYTGAFKDISAIELAAVASREAIRRAHAAMWPNGQPIGLMVKERDAMIQERLKADGLTPPSSRRIARALEDPQQERT